MADETRTRWLHVRLTDSEWKAVSESAARLGMTMSGYGRMCVSARMRFADAADCGDGALVEVDSQTMRSIHSELVRQGANVNQTARALNRIAGAPPVRDEESRLRLLSLARSAAQSAEKAAEGLDAIAREARRIDSASALGTSRRRV